MISREEKNKKYINEINKEKRIKVSRILFKFLITIFLITTLVFLYIYYIGPKGLETKEYVIKDSLIPDNFNGLKILHFSDLLYGSTIDHDNIKAISDEIKLINPDIVVFTGNIAGEDVNLEEDDINFLNEFFKDIPFTIGKYAVNGDLDSSSFRLIMENTNFSVLYNEIKEVYNGKDKISIIGIDAQEDKAINIPDTYTISLINNYDEHQDSLPNIVLAGFNLGGEIRLFDLPIIGTAKYLNTYYEEGNTKIFISSGLGTRHHMRLMNKPSLNVYRLYNN